MGAPPYMKLYVADYLGDTHHLGAVEHGAYLLLLMGMWRAGGSLPAADANLAKLARCTPEQWAEIRAAVLPFFKRTRQRLTHKRLAAEMAKYENTSGKRSEASNQRASKKGRNSKELASAKADDFNSNCTHNQNQNQKEERDADASLPESRPKPKREGPDPDLVERLWSLQPICGGKRKATRPEVTTALGAALKRGGSPGEIETAFRAYYALPDCTRDEGRYARGAAVLLHDDKWRDFGPQRVGPMGADWSESRWTVAVNLWRQDGSWDEALGPTPGQPGCRVPPNLLIRPTREAVT